MRRLLPPLIFVAVACVMTWPLAANMTARLAALHGPGDPFLNLWVLGWNLETISSDPAAVVNGRIFNANIFHPTTGTLAYTDHQILQSLAIWPVYAATGNVTLCYNLVLLLSLVLSAWAMVAFVRTVTGSTIAASIAGFVWGFCPFRFAHLPHLQLQALYWLPLTFLMLHRVVTRERRWDAIGLGAVVGLQALTSVYYGVIGGVGLIVAALAAAVTARRDRRFVRSLALAALMAVVVAAPGLWPYWRVQQREGAGRTVLEAERGSAVPSSYIQAPLTNLLYGRTGVLRPQSESHPPLYSRQGPEQELFFGFAVLTLAVVGLVRARKTESRLLIISLAAVGVTGLLLSFGPLGTGPVYAALHNVVPGFQAIRVPARFAVLLLFALAALAGIGAASLPRRLDGRLQAVLPALLALLVIGAEYFNGSIPYAPAPELPTATGRWLRDAPEPGAVLYLPAGRPEEDSPAMIASLEHRRPIVNGHSGVQPALYPAIIEQLSRFPDPLALLALRELDVRFVVSRTPVSVPPDPTPVVPRATLDAEVVYELRWTPESEATIAEAITVTPPPPGPPPFGIQETTRYYVFWVGGPLTIPAGEVAASIESRGDAGYRIKIRATTAAWMRRFFEADDELETETDTQLLPRVYRESINEGRRRRRRTVEFDHAGKRVIVTNAGTPPLTLPLQREARDALAALFYVRTLPLETGYNTRVPLNNAGRATIVDLHVAAEESIAIGRKKYDAWRIDPTFAIAVAPRVMPQATVWVSRDSRKLPLRIRVSAAFGTVELELVDYQAR